MGTRLANFKSKFSFSGKGRDSFSEEFDYANVFKNNAILMEVYGSVLKTSLHTSDVLWRKKFVESHIYKILRSLRKLYLVEIGAIYDLNNNTVKSTLNKLVEDIDKFKSNLFYFPTISLKGLISTLILIIPTAFAVITHLQENELPRVQEYVEIYGLLIFLGVYLEFFLVSAWYSLIDKHLLFIFPRYKFQGHFDKWKKMWKAYLGKKIEGTIYEKENKLFNSLKMKKPPEGAPGIGLFGCIFFVALFILEGISQLWGIPELGVMRGYFYIYNFPNKHHLLVFIFAILYISISLLVLIKRKAYLQ